MIKHKFGGRATGRTGRNLLSAINCASKGKTVLVSAQTRDYAMTLFKQSQYAVNGAFGAGTAIPGYENGIHYIRINNCEGMLLFVTHEHIEMMKDTRSGMNGLAFEHYPDHFHGEEHE